MPTSGTSHKFRIDVSKKEEVYVKQELLDCFIDNKKFLESIKGSKMESPENKKEGKGLIYSKNALESYIKRLEEELKACNDAWFSSTTPEHPYHIVYDTQTKIDYQQSYKSYVDSLAKQDRYTEIKSFDNWKEAINELLGIN